MLPVGGDWSLTDSNGVITADVRQTFQTDDGANIQIFETGRSQTDGTVHVRLTFETGSTKYAWLNNVVGVGILYVNGAILTIEAWQVSAYAWRASVRESAHRSVADLLQLNTPS